MSEERQEAVFPDGVFFNKPHENAPEFIKGSISFTDVAKFMDFLKRNQTQNQLSLDLKVSKAGKLYFQLNTWKPKPKDEAAPDKEEPPF